MNSGSLFATRYSTNNINVERGMDMLNHLPCFTEGERRTPVAISFYQEVLQQWIDKGNQPIAYEKYIDHLEMDLGVDKFIQHTSDFASVTIWKTYSLLRNEIYEGCLKHPRAVEIRETGEKLNAILDSPSTILENCKDIWDQLSTLPMYNRGRGKEDPSKKDLLEDFYKDISNTLFEKLLPYKFHAYGLLDVHIDSYGSNYLEMLLQMFFEEVQKTRGSNMRDIGNFISTVEIIIYLFLTHLYDPSGITDSRIYPFTMYIDRMCGFHIQTTLRDRIYKMIEEKPDYLKMLDKLHPSAAFLKAMPLTSEFNNYRDQVSGKNLDATWNSWLIFGNGYFSDKKLLVRDGTKMSVNSEFMYRVEKIDTDTLRSYIKADGFSFNIAPGKLAYLKEEKQIDLCKMVKPAIEGYEKEQRRYVAYVPGAGLFVLFQIYGSDDVFGIGIVEGKQGDRQIIKFGADESDWNYELVYGGEV